MFMWSLVGSVGVLCQNAANSSKREILRDTEKCKNGIQVPMFLVLRRHHVLKCSNGTCRLLDPEESPLGWNVVGSFFNSFWMAC